MVTFYGGSGDGMEMLGWVESMVVDEEEGRSASEVEHMKSKRGDSLRQGLPLVGDLLTAYM